MVNVIMSHFIFKYESLKQTVPAVKLETDILKNCLWANGGPSMEWFVLNYSFIDRILIDQTKRNFIEQKTSRKSRNHRSLACVSILRYYFADSAICEGMFASFSIKWQVKPCPNRCVRTCSSTTKQTLVKRFSMSSWDKPLTLNSLVTWKSYLLLQNSIL